MSTFEFPAATFSGTACCIQLRPLTLVACTPCMTQEARDLKEYEDMKECSFTPEINHRDAFAMPSPAKPVAVPGLNRYMELQVGPWT